MVEILIEALTGSLKSVYSMAVIVIPLMVILQIAREYHFLNKISEFFGFITKFFGMSKDSIFPLLVGIFFGISYGAGVIIESSNQGKLTKKDKFLLVVFLAACHGMIEDTLIFVVIGANGYLLIGLRVLAAAGLTYFLSRKLTFWNREPLASKKEKESLS